jgi:diguanylate cyclase (GGDEF)-like protein
MAPNYFFLMNDKRSSEKPIVPPDKSSEFERNLFTSCLQGLTESISTDVVLSKKLADFEAEVLKGESISSPIDLGKEIVKLNSIFIEEIKKIRESSRTLQDELEDQRRTSITLAEKLEQSQAQALVDPLTKVLNRAAYNMRIGQMVQEYKRYKEEWALLTLDIDHFKKFNDEFGHQLGDNVLKLVASTVKNCIRVSDRVFRYGGEEFVVLLGRINSEIATHLAEKICQTVERSYFVHGDKKLKVTVSIGGAIIATDDNELSIFERADKAMYQAKNNGRNQVVMDL